MKVLVVLILLFILFITNSSGTHDCKPCTKIYKCSTNEDTRWGISGNTCRVFRNQCLMDSENCKRRNNHEIEFRKTTREKCQRFCDTFCPFIYKPVCGEFRNGFNEYLNNCFMELHNCQSGESYIKISNTRCRCSY